MTYFSPSSDCIFTANICVDNRSHHRHLLIQSKPATSDLLWEIRKEGKQPWLTADQGCHFWTLRRSNVLQESHSIPQYSGDHPLSSISLVLADHLPILEDWRTGGGISRRDGLGSSGRNTRKYSLSSEKHPSGWLGERSQFLPDWLSSLANLVRFSHQSHFN